jgi:protein arginine kinase activator
MVCQICMKHSAVYHVQKIMSSKTVLIHLCKECADQTLEEELTNGFDDKLHNLLEGLIRSKDNDKRSTVHLKCQFCGTALRDVQNNKPMGCPHCYTTFSEYLMKETGLDGQAFSKQRYSNRVIKGLNTMKKELKEAIEAEDFEKAASLRDKIRQFEKENLFHEN